MADARYGMRHEEFTRFTAVSGEVGSPLLLSITVPSLALQRESRVELVIGIRCLWLKSEH